MKELSQLVRVDKQAVERAERALAKAKVRRAALIDEEGKRRIVRKCLGCSKGVPHGRRGRPREWCDECRGGGAFYAHTLAQQRARYHMMRERAGLAKGGRNESHRPIA